MNSSSVQLRRQRGAIAVLTGLMIVVLIGMAGLVLDLAHLYIVKTELQNAADACALSAVRELSTIDANTVARSTSAGILAGQLNRVNFQSAVPDIQNADITFGSNLDANASGKLLNFTREVNSDTQYVRCAPHEAQPISVAMWFMGVLGINESGVNADAVAKYPISQQSCAIPVALCKKTESFVVGNWYDGRVEPGGAISGGNYGWVQLEEKASGVPDISQYFDGDGLCKFGDYVYPDNGVKQSISAAWNTRFGLYSGSYAYKESDLVSKDEILKAHRPDKTGYSYQTPRTGGVYQEYLSKFLAYEPFNVSEIGQKTTNPNKGDPCVPNGTDCSPVDFGGNTVYLSKSDHQKYAPVNQSRRMVAVPVIDCSVPEKQKPTWACGLMLAPLWGNRPVILLEYRGMMPNEDCGGAGGLAGFPKLVR